MEEIITNEETAPNYGLVLTPEAQYYLNETAGWAKFLGIMGFLFCGFILIAAFSIGSILSYVSRFSPQPAAAGANMAGSVIGIVYGLMAVLYFFPSLYAFQFGTNAKKALLFSNTAGITIAIGKMKSFFKFWGIITIISLAFMVLGFIGLFAGMAAMHNIN